MRYVHATEEGKKESVEQLKRRQKVG